MQFAGVEAYLLDRKANGNLFELRFGNQYRNDELLSHFKIKNNETIVSEPVSFQNNLSYTTTDLYLNTIYRFKYKKITVQSSTCFIVPSCVYLKPLGLVLVHSNFSKSGCSWVQ